MSNLKTKILTAIENYESLDPAKTTVAEQFGYQVQIRGLVDLYNESINHDSYLTVCVWFRGPLSMIVDLERNPPQNLVAVRERGIAKPLDARAEWEQTV